MKLSNTLIGAIAVGVAIGSLSSCSVVNNVTGSDLPTISKDKKVLHCWDDCPACGMG